MFICLCAWDMTNGMRYIHASLNSKGSVSLHSSRHREEKLIIRLKEMATWHEVSSLLNLCSDGHCLLKLYWYLAILR